METMKALRFEKYGPPSVLSLQELRECARRTSASIFRKRATPHCRIRHQDAFKAEHDALIAEGALLAKK